MSEIFHPEDRGGQGRQAYDLASALHASGCEVRVLTRRHLAESRKHEYVGTVPVQRLPPLGITKGTGWRALLPTMIFLISLSWMLLRHVRRYDVILVHGAKLTLLPPTLIRRLFGKRVMVKIDATAEVDHAITVESLARMSLRQDALLARGWERLRRRLLSRAEAVIAISGQIRESLVRVGVPARRIFDIPNGLDLQRWQPATAETKRAMRLRLGLPSGPLFIYVGRLARSKGVFTLLPAWFEVCEKHPNAHLLVIGSGIVSHDDCEQKLRALHAASPHREKVIFTGQVDNVDAYLQASDVFVQCSEHEGFGLALAEAMACSLPCVTTPVGIAMDVIESGVNGILVPIGAVDALAAALAAMLTAPERWHAMGAAARHAVVNRYDLQAVARRYLQLLDGQPSSPQPQHSLSQVPP